MKVIVQVLLGTTWVDISNLPADDTALLQVEMKSQSRNHPGRRVRAVDEQGRLIDILT